MANVHGFRDLNANQNNRQRPNNDRYQNINPNIGDNVPFLNNTQPDRPPLEETIPYTIKMICCPTIKPWHLSCILSIIMIVLYIICCTQGIDKSKDVLAIAPNILIKFGAMQDILLADGEVYRLLSASFLHMNLLHITMNLISFVFLLSRL
jgi:membrane associated rhomboid family serine protease